MRKWRIELSSCYAINNAFETDQITLLHSITALSFSLRPVVQIRLHQSRGEKKEKREERRKSNFVLGAEKRKNTLGQREAIEVVAFF